MPSTCFASSAELRLSFADAEFSDAFRFSGFLRRPFASFTFYA